MLTPPPNLLGERDVMVVPFVRKGAGSPWRPRLERLAAGTDLIPPLRPFATPSQSSANAQESWHSNSGVLSLPRESDTADASGTNLTKARDVRLVPKHLVFGIRSTTTTGGEPLPPRRRQCQIHDMLNHPVLGRLAADQVAEMKGAQDRLYH